MNTHPHITVLSTPPDYWLDADQANDALEQAVAENSAANICASPNLLMSYLGSEDTADLFDGTLRLRLHSQSIHLGDAAIIAAFLPADEQAVMLSDIRAAVSAWITARELGA